MDQVGVQNSGLRTVQQTWQMHCYQVHSCHGHYHGNHQIDSLPEVPRLCRTLAYSVLCTCTHLSILLPPLGLMHLYHYVITVMITCTNQRISLQS